MKIKTANIRFLKNETESELRPKDVKETFTYADELFFIHRGIGKAWIVSHFKTGMRLTNGSRTIADAKEDFKDVMTRHEEHLTEAINGVLKKYGAANELPTEPVRRPLSEYNNEIVQKILNRKN